MARVLLVAVPPERHEALDAALCVDGFELSTAHPRVVRATVTQAPPDLAVLGADAPADIVDALGHVRWLALDRDPGRTAEAIRALFPPPRSIRVSAGVVDVETRRIADVLLTVNEMRLLRYFAAHPHRALSDDTLLQRVWRYAPGVRSRTVTTTVHRLRQKIEADPANPRNVLAVRIEAASRFEGRDCDRNGVRTHVASPGPAPAAATGQCRDR